MQILFNANVKLFASLYPGRFKMFVCIKKRCLSVRFPVKQITDGEMTSEREQLI